MYNLQMGDSFLRFNPLDYLVCLHAFSTSLNRMSPYYNILNKTLSKWVARIAPASILLYNVVLLILLRRFHKIYINLTNLPLQKISRDFCHSIQNGAFVICYFFYVPEQQFAFKRLAFNKSCCFFTSTEETVQIGEMSVEAMHVAVNGGRSKKFDKDVNMKIAHDDQLICVPLSIQLWKRKERSVLQWFVLKNKGHQTYFSVLLCVFFLLNNICFRLQIEWIINAILQT